MSRVGGVVRVMLRAVPYGMIGRCKALWYAFEGRLHIWYEFYVELCYRHWNIMIRAPATCGNGLLCIVEAVWLEGPVKRCPTHANSKLEEIVWDAHLHRCPS